MWAIVVVVVVVSVLPLNSESSSSKLELLLQKFATKVGLNLLLTTNYVKPQKLPKTVKI